MNSFLPIFVLWCFAPGVYAQRWALEPNDRTITVRGKGTPSAGVAGQAMVFDGKSLVELKDTSGLSTQAFTVTLWFNPHEPHGEQPVLAGKNRYSVNQRQWSLTIEPDGRLKAHLHQGSWRTITCADPLKTGTWHQVALTVQDQKAVLYLDGKAVGELNLKAPVATADAPVTLGGIWDANAVRRPFYGALDEFNYDARALGADEVKAGYQPVSVTYEVPPELQAGLALWDGTRPVPKSAELEPIEGAQFHVIKKQRPDDDGCRWTLGVGLAWHKGRLYASYGFNRGEENTPTEEAHVRVSRDGGRTWGASVVMDAGEGDLGVSHGVFSSHDGRLWAFMGAFYAHTTPYHRVHTRAYLLNESTERWESLGPVVESGFWPMQEPLKMANGNWIMAGLRIGGTEGNLPAVAISHGDNFMQWHLVVIPTAPNLGSVWGESTVIVDGNTVINISRYGRQARALLSVSEDLGRTWTKSDVSNLPMATSRPYAGTLSTGQRFLICTTTADRGGTRSPLTIAVSRPGQSVLSKVLLIRRSQFPEGPGISGERVDFSYPYAVEHAGKLCVGYTHKSHAANELAILPVAGLHAER